MYHLHKAKRLDNKEWIEGNLIVFKKVEQTYRIIFIPVESSSVYIEKESVKFPSWYLVDSDTICSFIGMMDQNGEKIWEHDLIRDSFDNLFLVCWNVIQCAYYAVLLQQYNGKQVRGCFRIGALRYSKLKRVGSIFDKGMMRKRWLAYFNRFIYYPILQNLERRR